jgi:hypothetical protein
MRSALIALIAFLSVASSRAGDEPLLTFDATRAREISLEAIREKYPEIRIENMSFNGWSANSKTNAPPTLTVSFLLNNPTVEIEKDDATERSTKSKQQTIDVILTANGQVKNVSKGSQMVFESRSKRLPNGQQQGGGYSPPAVRPAQPTP